MLTLPPVPPPPCADVDGRLEAPTMPPGVPARETGLMMGVRVVGQGEQQV